MSEVVSIGRPWDLSRQRLSRRLRLPSGGGVWRSGRAFRDYDLHALARVRAQCALAARERLRAPLATMASPGAPDIPALSHPVHTTTPYCKRSPYDGYQSSLSTL